MSVYDNTLLVGKRITDLPAADGITSNDDLLALVDEQITKKVTVQILKDYIASGVLDQLNSQPIGALQTDNKKLIDAINELNKKITGLQSKLAILTASVNNLKASLEAQVTNIQTNASNITINKTTVTGVIPREIKDEDLFKSMKDGQGRTIAIYSNHSYETDYTVNLRFTLHGITLNNTKDVDPVVATMADGLYDINELTKVSLLANIPREAAVKQGLTVPTNGDRVVFPGNGWIRPNGEVVVSLEDRSKVWTDMEIEIGATFFRNIHKST